MIEGEEFLCKKQKGTCLQKPKIDLIKGIFAHNKVHKKGACFHLTKTCLKTRDKLSLAKRIKFFWLRTYFSDYLNNFSW